MKLTHIKGNTYYIRGGTNTGVYVCENKDAVVIDPGLPGFRIKNMIKVFNEEKLNVKWIINTHEHDDHYGATNQLKEEYTKAITMSTEIAKVYIEKPQLFATYIIGGKTNKFMNDKLRNNNEHIVKIDITLNQGTLNVGDSNIEIMDLKGHTEGSIGIYTKDKVLFVGDSLIGANILNKFDLLFLFNVEEYIETLDKIKNIDFEYVVLGHGKEILNRHSAMECIDYHEKIINKYLHQIRGLLKKYSTLEVVLKSIINNNNLSCNYKEYHFFKSTVVSMISYLIKLNEVDYVIDNGELLYYTK
ncbi:MAG: MBL fold metallo-hydrolase [Paraclostridium sp.]